MDLQNLEYVLELCRRNIFSTRTASPELPGAFEITEEGWQGL
jgi:hypothetical protein